jgi:hypothetical protein
MHEPGEEDEAEAGEAAARVPSDPLRLLVITANREQHSFTLAAPESKTVGDFKNDLEGAAWIKHDQQLLFLLSKDVHLLWDDSTPMSELLGPSTSPRVRRGPVRVLLARDFLGVMAYRASLPAWYEDHYKLMLHMFAPDPVMPAEEVYPGVFLGELGAVYRRAQLRECKIRSILSLECMPPLWPDDFQYMVIHAEESENCNMLEIFEHALKFIQESTKKGKVLVHWYSLTFTPILFPSHRPVGLSFQNPFLFCFYAFFPFCPPHGAACWESLEPLPSWSPM